GVGATGPEQSAGCNTAGPRAGGRLDEGGRGVSQDESQVGARVADDQRSPEEIRREIEETRQELGDTAAALAAKTDVKSRAKEKVEDIKQTVTEKTDAKVEGIKQTVAEKKESFASSSSATGTAASGSQGSSPLDQVKAK